MKIEKFTFIHFFVADKEYLLEIETIKYARIGEDTFSIFFIADSIPAIADFFLKRAEQEFLFFFGNSEERLNQPVISRAGMFNSSVKKDGLFGIQFKNIKEV